MGLVGPSHPVRIEPVRLPNTKEAPVERPEPVKAPVKEPVPS